MFGLAIFWSHGLNGDRWFKCASFVPGAQVSVSSERIKFAHCTMQHELRQEKQALLMRDKTVTLTHPTCIGISPTEPWIFLCKLELLLVSVLKACRLNGCVSHDDDHHI